MNELVKDIEAIKDVVPLLATDPAHYTPHIQAMLSELRMKVNQLERREMIASALLERVEGTMNRLLDRIMDDRRD